MASVAAHPDRRQVTTAQAPAGEPPPALLDPPNDTDTSPLAIASEGGEDLAEPVDAVEQPEDLLWDEEESAALRQARKDATLSASADSVREYLKQIGKVALLTAEQEVVLAARIEAGLYAAERLHRAQDSTEKLSPQLRRDLSWIVGDGQRVKNHLLEANLRLVVSLAKRYRRY